MKPIRINKLTFTNKQFGKALELYYNKNLHNIVSVGKFLNYVFKLNDLELRREDTYFDGCRLFKERYVKD